MARRQFGRRSRASRDHVTNDTPILGSRPLTYRCQRIQGVRHPQLYTKHAHLTAQGIEPLFPASQAGDEAGDEVRDFASKLNESFNVSGGKKGFLEGGS